MKHVISAVVAVVCILIGGITGHFVKTGLSAAASHLPTSARRLPVAVRWATAGDGS